MGNIREERAFWAHQLHANLLNSIGAVIVQSQVCERAIELALPNSLEEVLRLRQMLFYLEETTRLLATSATRGQSLGLLQEVGRRIQDLRQQHPDISILLRVRGLEERVPRRVTGGIVAVLTEALLNAVRHGRPRSVEIDLTLESRSILLRIRDDGLGFDASRVSDQDRGNPARRSCGLAIMHEHSSALGGKLAISSAVGRGTQVTLQVPLQFPRADVASRGNVGLAQRHPSSSG